MLDNESASGSLSPAPKEATDSFGCPFDKLFRNQTLQGADISFFRKGSLEPGLAQVTTPPSDRGFAIGVANARGHRRRIFHEHHATTYEFDEDSIYLRSLADPYKADLGGPFDFLLLEISPAGLQRIAQESDLVGVGQLQPQAVRSDPVLANLVKSLIPALEKPEVANPLFVDQLASAIGVHLVQEYGGKIVSAKATRKLSRSHEALAKNILIENLAGDVTILELAKACNLSRGYFIQAFRETTGLTPYRWLQNERISKACELLRVSDMTLSEIAKATGFVDQSHFTRTFTSALGMPPGKWRRVI